MHRRILVRALPAASLLAVCGGAMGQLFEANFEAPTYSGSAAGTPTTGQQGWYLPPVAGSQDHRVYTYAGNALGISANPTGGAQFDGGEGNVTGPARAQHPVDFSTGGIWQAEWDCTGLWDTNVGATAVNNIGSWSMQDSATTRYFQQLMSWGGAGNNYQGPNSPPPDRLATHDLFHIHFGYFTAPAVAIAFAVPGPEFLDLPVNNWFHVTTRWNFDTAQVLQVSIKNLTTNGATTTYDVTSLGWYLQGGPNSTLPLPTDIRLFAGGNGDISAWDNVRVFKVVSCYPDCNGDHALNVNDFICFQSAFAASTAQADCDNNSTLNVNDFICFQSAFAAGCSQL